MTQFGTALGVENDVGLQRLRRPRGPIPRWETLDIVGERRMRTNQFSHHAHVQKIFRHGTIEIEVGAVGVQPPHRQVHHVKSGPDGCSGHHRHKGRKARKEFEIEKSHRPKRTQSPDRTEHATDESPRR